MLFTKIELNNLRLIGVYSNPEEGRILQYPDNRVHLIDIVYTLRSNFKQLKKSDESIELKFFSFDNLPKLIVPPAIVPLKDISRVLYD